MVCRDEMNRVSKMYFRKQIFQKSIINVFFHIRKCSQQAAWANRPAFLTALMLGIGLTMLVVDNRLGGDMKQNREKKIIVKICVGFVS